MDNPPLSNAPETITTDNTSTIAPQKPVDGQPQEFSYALGEKIAESLQKAQANTDSEEQTPPFGVAAKLDLVRLWLAQYPLSTEAGSAGTATKLEPKAGRELAQLLANLDTDKFPPGSGETGKPAENMPLQSAPGQNQTTLKAVLPSVSRGSLPIYTQPADVQPVDIQPGENENTGKIQISNKTPVAAILTPPDTSRQSGGELINNVSTADSETAAVSQKPAIAGTPAASDSQKTTSLSGKEIMPEALGTDGKTPTAGEKPAIVEEPATSGGQKAPVQLILNDNLPVVEDEASDAQQKAPVGSEKPPLIAKESTGSKADIGPQQQVPLELSSDGGKEQNGSTSGNLVGQKLNLAQVQISVSQTKEHSGSTSSNSSDSKAEGPEQILSGDNAQAPVMEQSSAVTTAAKSTGDSSPNDVSAGVSEQIQSSISSSLREGDRQITIHLNPPELGKVFIKFQERDGQITGLLEVSERQTRVEIQRILPQIVQNLQNLGIQIKRLEVVPSETDQSEQQTYKDQTLQDNWSGQQGSAGRNNASPNTFGTSEWLTNDNSYAGFTESQEMLVTDNSINILI
jgi:flagellar hook-length control protein FliK